MFTIPTLFNALPSEISIFLYTRSSTGLYSGGKLSHKSHIMNIIIEHLSIFSSNDILSTNPSIRTPCVLCTFAQLPVTVSCSSAVELKSLCVAISVCGSSPESRHCTSSVLGLLRATTETRPTASVHPRLTARFRFSYFRFRLPATSSADTFCTNGQ